MSEKDNKNRGIPALNLTRTALGAVIAMLITLALMFVSAWLIGKQMLGMDQGDKMVMLSVFLGTVVGTLLTIPRQGRGTITTGMTVGAMYIVLLLVLAIASGTEKLFGSNFLKMLICASAGSSFGSALKSGRKRGNVKHKRKKIYN